MKSIFEKTGGLLYCLIEIVIGILLFINPIGFTSGILLVVGIVLALFGIVTGIEYFKLDAREAAARQLLKRGMITALIGGLCIYARAWLDTILPIITIAYGVIILVTGLGKVQTLVDALRMKEKRWVITLISAVISLVLAFIILSRPFASTEVLWMFIAISLIVDAAIDIFAIIFSPKAKDSDYYEDKTEE